MTVVPLKQREVFSLRDLAECAEREVKLRQRVYPNRIETGRMSAREAERQIAMMTEIAKRLREEEQQWERLV